MRDILITLIVFGSLPLILRNPVNGVLMWVWISVMNPHTQSWGFAATFPFAFIVAVTTLFSVAISRLAKTLPVSGVTFTLIALVLWMNVTTLFAMFPAFAYVQWSKVMKIMLMSLVTMMVIRHRDDIQRLLWVLVMSLGFYGVKGGLFTLRTGGGERVWGPEGTFIGDNNEIALALIMTIPLMRYLQLRSDKRWLRHGLGAMMLLSAMAALGSYSRGGLLAIAAMIMMMWLKSRHKFAAGILIALLAPLALLFMPERWTERMDSIGAYQQDESAMGRINAWYMAWNLAKDRFFGGGFEIAEPATFFLYAPNPHDVHAAHSIYFQALGEHGFVGLALYLLLLGLTWRSAAWIVRHSRDQPELEWAQQLATMVQASLVGFAVGGAFLSLLYFDVPYYLMGIIVATRALVAQRQHAVRPSVHSGLDNRQPAIGQS
ncbi:putative O-glycosylation ligase, exosortase A system-associated [Duganella violaceipulchra]|uniref:O-glycosylation ligase (Exosortase A-associated) n=1 Tax=Duganella violaceipulchra TaxID=2849652 RepID=A0AA41L031_9BURK|nr:putative O-glycosylation ligase, exosortase A system-associated [Duganella violaceicalia]MBV6321866.1 putative O-glycosylation ligase, exosortase A system-associated [Duganella violaceicalia]MCP2007140.1 putative O-glycosylation ligase (exosortase A-associated) [Duganella violaceicalia]